MILAVKTPDYITVKEMAEAWGVTRRYVNMCLEDGRIPGAVRMGNMWLVPKGEDKPAGPRREQKAPEKSLSSELAYILEAVCIPSPRDNPYHILESAGEERLRLICECALAYARGDFEKTICCFRQNESDDAAKLCACPIAIPAAITMGDYPLFIEIESYLKNVVQANISEEVTAFAELALTTAYLSSMATNMVPDWLKDGDFSALPPQVKPDAAYKRAKYFQCIGNYEAMLAVAQTALAFFDSEDEMSFPGSYLRLACTVALYSLERLDEAEHFLLDAMRINLPHGFITGFAELAAELGGMVEQLLKREYPVYYDAVIEQWKRTVPNWIEFHNHFTKDNITSMLSLREYEIASLVARGIPYKKIAEQFHMSLGTLKNKMSIICEKLFVTGRDRRKELAKFILLPRKK